MRWFDYAAPTSLAQTVAALAGHARAVPLAGGTDLLVQLRFRQRQADVVVDVKRVPELNQLSCTETGLVVGAAVPCSRIAQSAEVLSRWPALSRVARLIGGVQIQSRATLGGNVCNASPSADAVAVLIALRATCHVAGPAGARTIPLDEFFLGPGRTVLRHGELLAWLHLPRPEPCESCQYIRFTPREEMDIAVAGVAAAVAVEANHFVRARIVLSAVGPTPILARTAADLLVDEPADGPAIDRAADAAMALARPISDARASADYRRHLSGVLARRALQRATAESRQTP